MNAQRFYGDADGPDLAIYQADDRTLLPGCRGWTCAGCETIWAFQAEAEACCLVPDVVVGGPTRCPLTCGLCE